MQSNAIVSCILLLFHNVCCYQDNWVEPHAWAELTTTPFNTPGEDACQCQALPPEEKSLASIEDQLALMYFKKFVNTLFSRKKLMVSRRHNHCQICTNDVMSIIFSMAKRQTFLSDRFCLHYKRHKLLNLRRSKMCVILIFYLTKY